MKTEVVVRKATTEDVPGLSKVLARAFHDDPAFSWAAPNPDRRDRHGPRYFELLLRRTYLPKHEVYATEGGEAVALWGPPDKWLEPFSASLPFFPTMLRACGTKLPRAIKMLSLMETKHKEHVEPHFYLAYIAADPSSQGKGFGTALLNSMLDRCDAEKTPAYLEATSMKNQALYYRHGFNVVEEVNWPDGGPPFWRMWRQPR